MTFLHALILGIVEGLTEFLPVSSTAHMEFASYLLGIPETAFVKSFLIFIQLGAILAVVVLFAPRYIKSWKTYKEVIIAFVPTAVVGFIFYKLIKTYLVGNLAVAGIALILGGILFIWLERRHARKATPHTEKLSFWNLIGIGLAQAVAVFPGVSRSGAIVAYGLARDIDRDTIVEFAFLLAIPTMLAAAGYDLLKSHAAFSGGEWTTLLVGFLAAFVSALCVIKWFIGYIKSHSFEAFGWYRIIAGGVILATVFLIAK